MFYSPSALLSDRIINLNCAIPSITHSSWISRRQNRERWPTRLIWRKHRHWLAEWYSLCVPNLVCSTVNFIDGTGYVCFFNAVNRWRLPGGVVWVFVCERCKCLYTWDVACSLSGSSLTPQKNVIMFFWPAEHLQEVNPLKHREISGLKPQHFSDSFRVGIEWLCMHMEQYWEAALKWAKQ